MTDQSSSTGVNGSANSGSTTSASQDGVVAQGTYALLRSRLEAAASELTARAGSLNDARLATFGSSQFELLGTERVRTESNAVPRDVINVGDELVLAYNAVTGVSSQVRPEDVFGVHHLELGGASGQVSFSPNPEGLAGSVLDDDQFRRDFEELHTYFKSTTLQQVYRTGQRLLAVFRTGQGINDVRVLRWQISPDNELQYLDARGERDHSFPTPQDVDWTPSTRADHIDASHIRIDDRVLLNPLGGTLEIRIDDGGEGSLLLEDPLSHSDQSLQDCEIGWARSADLVLIDLLPYGENTHRYYVVNLLTHAAVRLDSLGEAFRQLPDGQGLIFPEGVYLKTGELRTFDLDVADMEMLEVVRSPNGEDVLYVFYEQAGGRSILLSYNVVRQEVAAPIWCHGHTIFDDGTMVVFREEPEPTRIHPIQIWITPFCSDEYAAAQPREDSEFDRIGNAALVSGIADALGLARLVGDVEPSSAVYADLLSSAGRFIDTHHWSGDAETGDLAGPAHDIRTVAEQVLDEFERMQEVRAGAAEALAEAEESLSKATEGLRLDPPRTTEAFIAGLATMRREIGHLHTTREKREIDVGRVDELIELAEESHDGLAQDAAGHLSTDGAFEAYHLELVEIANKAPKAESSIKAAGLLGDVDDLSDSMDLVAGTVGDLVVDDPRIRTSVLSQVSSVLAEVNRVRAVVELRSDELIQSETGAAFSTELGLLGQSIATAVGRASTPEACDESLARLMLQLEQLETAGPRTEAQLDELADRRDQVTEALSSRRQQLVDDRQQKAERLVGAADRTLKRVAERAEALASTDDVNGFFAADPMVARVRSLLEDLRDLGEPVRADELQSRIGSARDGAVRALRDRADLFDGDAVKLGRHKFSVDDRSRELTVVPTANHLDAVLTGTDLRVELRSEVLNASPDLWDRPLMSETPALYRSLFLAGDLVLGLLDSTLVGRQLEAALESDEPEALLNVVRDQVDDRLGEGYDRGVHDLDAAAILRVLGPLGLRAEALITPGVVRAAAQRSWARDLSSERRQVWIDRGRSGAGLEVDRSTMRALSSELAEDLGASRSTENLQSGAVDSLQEQARYLVSELFRAEAFAFGHSRSVASWLDRFGRDKAVSGTLSELENDADGAYSLVSDYVSRRLDPGELHLVPELVTALIHAELPTRVVDVDLAFQVEGLTGRHTTLKSGTFAGRIDDVLANVERHRDTEVPAHRAFSTARKQALDGLRDSLRLKDLEPAVPEGFVRNQLIDKVYLPLIGDNLARQIGTVDDRAGARSGLLMLLSPPGYGKTTLVEYIADRLGMALVKVSGPGLGHEVTSLDPDKAPSATAAREIERINLSFAIGSNVILYLDDIQHTNPEFLQRFISLCDGQRRIEGVWDGEARTFDLRGKRFAVVMAGNPYTESGERFRIPDMLANRADTYNLGDVLSGDEVVFAGSYLENALTANPLLASLAGSSPDDLQRFFNAADGETLEESALEGSFSSAESNEIVSTLRHLRQVQKVVLGVNRLYIASAATDDQYRTEPPFLLQGSYRNMARMASKLLPIMTVEEVDRIIDEHYTAESQALTGAAEWNLLRLSELRGTLDGKDRARWEDILATFRRQQRLGGDDRDPATRVVAAIEMVADAFGEQGLESRSDSFRKSAPAVAPVAPEVNVVVQAAELVPPAINVVVEAPDVVLPPIELVLPAIEIEMAEGGAERRVRPSADWIAPPMPPTSSVLDSDASPDEAAAAESDPAESDHDGPEVAASDPAEVVEAGDLAVTVERGEQFLPDRVQKADEQDPFAGGPPLPPERPS